MGRGGAAAHHPAAAQDHGDFQEVGDEETVPGPDNLRRPSGCASAPQTQRRPGYTLHQGRRMQISAWVSSQKLRLISAAVRVNQQFLCCWRLRNQRELDAVVEELSALLPTSCMNRRPLNPTVSCSSTKPKNEMFYLRFEERS